MVMMEAYFDESYSEDSSNLIAVSGYIFEKDKCLALDLEWADLLREGGDGNSPLPYFRMSSCAHGNKPFHKLDALMRDRLARRAIKAIKDNVTHGVSASIFQSDYEKWLPKPNTIGSAYVWCCWMSLIGVRAWAEKTGFQGEIAYFFEAGDAQQSEANGVMNRIFSDVRFREAQRYAKHAFVRKEFNRPVQTADILAWHHVQEVKKQISGKLRRKDFSALIDGVSHRVVHGHKEMFEDLELLASIFVR